LVGLVTLSTNSASISNCYCTGSVQGNSYCGGLIGLYEKGDLTVTNCYSTSIVTSSTFAAGGLIGIVSAAAVSMSNSAAWNPSVTASSIGATNWSTGAVVGVTFPVCTLTDNYRNPTMAIKAYWGNVAGYEILLAADYSQANVSSNHHLTDSNGNEMEDTTIANNKTTNPHYPQFPYHGKVETGKTLSELASTTLGWDSTIWDFSSELPTLK
jgi:hypothetical protein